MSTQETTPADPTHGFEADTEIIVEAPDEHPHTRKYVLDLERGHVYHVSAPGGPYHYHGPTFNNELEALGVVHLLEARGSLPAWASGHMIQFILGHPYFDQGPEDE